MVALWGREPNGSRPKTATLGLESSPNARPVHFFGRVVWYFASVLG
jgi:hypothetical protein